MTSPEDRGRFEPTPYDMGVSTDPDMTWEIYGRTHVEHPRPGQIWGPGQEPGSVRDAWDRQARDRVQVRAGKCAQTGQAEARVAAAEIEAAYPEITIWM